MRKLIMEKHLRIFSVLLLLSFIAISGTPLLAQDDNSIAKQAYYEYFNTRKVDYNETQKLFNNDSAPIAAYIADRAKVSPAEVNRVFINSNQNWNNVMQRFNISPSTLFLPVPKNYRVGPPYGKAYGYWRNHQNNPTYKIKLNNNDINNLVNMNIINGYYKTPATDIIKSRSEGNSFNMIIKNQHAHKNQMKAQVKQKNQGQGQGQGKDKDDRENKGNGKGKGKNK